MFLGIVSCFSQVRLGKNVGFSRLWVWSVIQQLWPSIGASMTLSLSLSCLLLIFLDTHWMLFPLCLGKLKWGCASMWGGTLSVGRSRAYPTSDLPSYPDRPCPFAGWINKWMYEKIMVAEAGFLSRRHPSMSFLSWLYWDITDTEPCVSFRCMMCWSDIFINCKMMTTTVSGVTVHTIT